MRDFTLKTYCNLLETLQQKNYTFITFEEYISNKGSMLNAQSSIERNTKIVIFRHDVDRKPLNSLITAKLENELGIKGSYYFRIVSASFDEKIIKEIVSLGHEVGYHYEEMSSPLLISPHRSEISLDQRIDKAFDMFKENLERLRNIVPVTTICAHGSPLSKFDNKMIWEKYDYKTLGILADAHLDTDWNEFAYFTDTGRRWDGEKASVRDKVHNTNNAQYLMINVKLRKTQDIIKALEQNQLPNKIMITVHPQRWTDDYLPWGKELVWQNVKNVVKRFVVMNE